jgi:hypothetical protein
VIPEPAIVADGWQLRLPSGVTARSRSTAEAVDSASTRHRSSCERGLDPDDVAVMALNHDVDLAPLLVAVVKELDRPLGPFGLAQELHRNEALEDGPSYAAAHGDSPFIGLG